MSEELRADVLQSFVSNGKGHAALNGIRHT
jgi:hypothetical protein